MAEESSNSLDKSTKKRVSKSKKRNWRKHTDVQDVEEYLEDKRLQERTGGIVADKSDEQLFFVDKEVKTLVARPVREAGVGSKRKRGRLLKCDKALIPNPSITPARVPHNVLLHQSLAKKACVRKKEQELKGELSSSRQAAVRQSRDSREQRHTQLRQDAVGRRQGASYDLWTAHSNGAEEEGNEHYRKVTKRRRCNVPKSYHKKPSELESVTVPHPGASYNPALDDFQELLAKAHKVEVVKDKAERKIIQATDGMFPTRDQAPTQESVLAEMGEGVLEAQHAAVGDNEVQGSEGEDSDHISVNPPVLRENKKTITQRNKEKRQKLLQKQKRKEKLQRIKMNNFTRVRSARAEVAKVLKQRETRATERQVAASKAGVRTKKLGKLRFEEPDIEVKLMGELKGSLRLLKPEGNLVEDRFKSLQRRNIIEPRKRAKVVKKYKRKEFEKKAHKAVVL